MGQLMKVESDLKRMGQLREAESGQEDGSFEGG